MDRSAWEYLATTLKLARRPRIPITAFEGAGLNAEARSATTRMAKTFNQRRAMYCGNNIMDWKSSARHVPSCTRRPRLIDPERGSWVSNHESNVLAGLNGSSRPRSFVTDKESSKVAYTKMEWTRDPWNKGSRCRNAWFSKSATRDKTASHLSRAHHTLHKGLL